MKLIVQGQELSEAQLTQLTIISGAISFVQMTKTVYRFNKIANNRNEKIITFTNELKLDIAIVPDDISLSDFKLLAMDMDCTFIQIECIDEIADMNGLKKEVAAITKASMSGEMDFNESLTRRVALLSGLDAKALERVYNERLKLSPGAEIMLQKLKEAGIMTLLISGGFTYFTDRLQLEYGIDYTRANTLEIIDGKLTGKIIGTIVNAHEKAKTLLNTCSELGIQSSQTIAIGDGANDIDMLSIAGISIAFHSKPKVKSVAKYSLDFVGLDGVINILS